LLQFCDEYCVQREAWSGVLIHEVLSKEQPEVTQISTLFRTCLFLLLVRNEQVEEKTCNANKQLTIHTNIGQLGKVGLDGHLALSDPKSFQVCTKVIAKPT
jgi:hypothetical protein